MARELSRYRGTRQGARKGRVQLGCRPVEALKSRALRAWAKTWGNGIAPRAVTTIRSRHCDERARRTAQPCNAASGERFAAFSVASAENRRSGRGSSRNPRWRWSDARLLRRARVCDRSYRSGRVRAAFGYQFSYSLSGNTCPHCVEGRNPLADASGHEYPLTAGKTEAAGRQANHFSADAQKKLTRKRLWVPSSTLGSSGHPPRPDYAR
jgi:hypothetical protein